MSLDFRQELRFIATEVRRRFLTASVNLAAPRNLFGLPDAHWRRDMVGALAVSVMAVPQVIAYALIAGVPPVMGLYSLVVVTLVSALWCHSTNLAYGPSNASSLMLGAVLITMEAAPGDLTTRVALAAVVIGAVQLAAAFLSVGNLTRYISRSVIVGYTTAIGALIFLNQINNLIGTSVDKHLGLFARVWASLRTLPDLHLPSVMVAVAAFLAMALGRRLVPLVPGGFCAIVGGGLYAYAMQSVAPEWKVKLVSDIQRIPFGLPALVLPDFNLNSVYQLVGPAIALALLGCIEVSTVSKSLAMRTGHRTQPNQDIFALGLGNFCGGFFGAMPGSVSFTRTEFSLHCFVQTRWWGVLCAMFGLAILLACRQLLEYIPIPALAALIMWLSLKLIDLKNIRIALTSTYSDALVYLTTFAAALFLRLDSAIYLGVLVSMGLFLQKASVPKLMEFEFDEQGRFRPAKEGSQSATPQVSIVHVEGELFYGAAESIQDEIMRTIEPGHTKVVILRLRNARNLDASGVMVLQQLIADLKQLSIHVLVSGTSPEIDRVVQRAGLDVIIGKDNYFPSQDNFLDATRRAMVRAKELAGVASPEIKLFYDRDKEQERAAPPSSANA